MDNINFTSRIVPLKSSDFSKFVSTIPKTNFVDYPWTIGESKIGTDVYTKNICDCSSCLISNGEKAILLHLTPSVQENHFFQNVLYYLRDNLNLGDKNLQAILVGSKNTKSSQDIFNKFCELLDYLKIPKSILKIGKSPVNIAYKSSTDEFIVSNSHIERALKKSANNKDALDSGFEEIKISDVDEV